MTFVGFVVSSHWLAKPEIIFKGGTNIEIRLCPCDELTSSTTTPRPTAAAASAATPSLNNNNSSSTDSEVTDRPGKYYYFKL